MEVGWAAHFPVLDARSHFNLTLNTSTVHEDPWIETNTTRAKIANLQLEQVQATRTMHLTLGAFSLALALLTVHRILSDARRVAVLQVSLRKQRFKSLRNVHPAETFPLAIVSGAALQQVFFVAVQSTTLGSILSDSCRELTMIAYPALFLIGYITLVFGAETALRAVRSERFAPRGKWNTTICTSTVFVMQFLTWIPTIAWPMSKRCFGSLIWFPMRYDLLTLVIVCVLVGLLLLLAGLISIQLLRTTNVDPNERIAASRMSYFLLITALIYILVIPVEVQSLRRDFASALDSSRVAEASLFSSGMIITFFHLFLRTNAERTVIRPIEELKAPQQQKRPKIRFFGPSDLEMNISGPMALRGGRRPDSRQGLIDVGPEKNRADFDPEYFMQQAAREPELPSSMNAVAWPLTDTYTPTDRPLSHQRKGSNYSLFPTDTPRLPATAYDPSSRRKREDGRESDLPVRRFRQSSVTDVSSAFDILTHPRPMFANRQSRAQSTDSSLTVEIGLRFSLAPATLGASKNFRTEQSPPLPPASTSPVSSLRQSPQFRTDNAFPILSSVTYQPSTTARFQEQEQDILSPKSFSPNTSTLNTPTRPRPTRSPGYPPLAKDKSLPLVPYPPLPKLATASTFTSTPSPPAPAPAPAPAPRPSLAAPLSGLRMNPITPTTPIDPSPQSSPILRSESTNKPKPPQLGRTGSTRTPGARIPMGAGTMTRRTDSSASTSTIASTIASTSASASANKWI